MKSIAMIGDPHFGRKAEHPTIKQCIQQGQEQYFDWLANDLKQRNIRTVLFSGDIFDTRNSINVEALIKTIRMFNVKFADFECIIDLGNHDMYYENSYDICSTEVLSLLSNVTLIKDDIKKLNIFDKNIYVIPWIIPDKLHDFTDFLDSISDHKDQNVLFGHFEMMGIDMEGGNISTFGLSSKLFADSAKYVFSGHYHGQSSLTIGDSSIIYLGSPYPLTFANSDSKHGYWILNEDMSYEFIENTISPKFKTVMDTDIDSLGDCTNTFVRLYINNTKTKEYSFDIKSKVEAKNPLMIRVIPYKDGSVEENKNYFQLEANKIMNMDLFSISEMYIDNNYDNLPILKTGDAKQRVLSRVKNLFEKVNNKK